MGTGNKNEKISLVEKVFLLSQNSILNTHRAILIQNPIYKTWFTYLKMGYDICKNESCLYLEIFNTIFREKRLLILHNVT